jgi:hypothetical protein
MRLQHEIDFKQFVVGGLQSQAVVSLAGAGIVRVHIQAQAADVGSLAGEIVQMTEQGAEHAAAAAVLADEHALDPPEISVAPIAPFVGDEQLPGEGAVDFRHKINSFRGIAEQGVDAGSDPFGIKPPLFGLEREAEIAVRNKGGVGSFGLSDDDFDASS